MQWIFGMVFHFRSFINFVEIIFSRGSGLSRIELNLNNRSDFVMLRCRQGARLKNETLHLRRNHHKNRQNCSFRRFYGGFCWFCSQMIVSLFKVMTLPVTQADKEGFNKLKNSKLCSFSIRDVCSFILYKRHFDR